MSIIAESIMKVAQANQIDADRISEHGRKYAGAYLGALERFTKLSDEELEAYRPAIEAGVKQAQLEAPSLAVMEKHGEWSPGHSKVCLASEDEVATFVAAAAERLAEATEASELADPSVQEGIIHIAMGLSEHAALSGLLPMPPDKKDDEEEEEDDGEKKKDKKDEEDEPKDEGDE